MALGTVESATDARLDRVERLTNCHWLAIELHFRMGEREVTNRFDGLGVHDDFVETGARDAHLGDVAVHQLKGLGPESLQEQPSLVPVG